MRHTLIAMSLPLIALAVLLRMMPPRSMEDVVILAGGIGLLMFFAAVGIHMFKGRA